MPQLTSISCNPTNTQTPHDVPLPTRQERLTALLDALKHQQDHQINQLLHAIRRDPDPDMAGVVGEVYFEADEHQQLAMDIWSEHLSADQRFIFNSRKEDARSMGFSKLLTVALEQQHDTLLDVLLKSVFDTARSWAWPMHLSMLLRDLYRRDEPFQERVLNKLIETISRLETSDDEGTGEIVLEFINKMPNMTLRAELLEKISRHWEEFTARTKEAEMPSWGGIWEGFMPRFMDSLALLNPPSLKILALFNLSKIEGMNMDGYSWKLLKHFTQTMPLDAVPAPLLQPWIHVLREHPEDELVHDLSNVIEARYKDQKLSQEQRLEMLSSLMNLGHPSEEKHQLMQDILIPALVPGLRRDAVFEELAQYVCKTANADHLEVLENYLNVATGDREIHLAVKLSVSLRHDFPTTDHRSSIDPRTYARFFATRVALLTRLPAEERWDQLNSVALILEDAVFLDWPCHKAIREMSSRVQRFILVQLEKATHGLQEDFPLDNTQKRLERIREHLG